MPLQIATPEGQRDMTPQEEAAWIAQRKADADAAPIPKEVTKEALLAEIDVLKRKVEALGEDK